MANSLYEARVLKMQSRCRSRKTQQAEIRKMLNKKGEKLVVTVETAVTEGNRKKYVKHSTPQTSLHS